MSKFKSALLAAAEPKQSGFSFRNRNWDAEALRYLLEIVESFPGTQGGQIEISTGTLNKIRALVSAGMKEQGLWHTPTTASSEELVQINSANVKGEPGTGFEKGKGKGDFACWNCNYYKEDSCGQDDMMQLSKQPRLENGRVQVEDDDCCEYVDRAGRTKEKEASVKSYGLDSQAPVAPQLSQAPPPPAQPGQEQTQQQQGTAPKAQATQHQMINGRCKFCGSADAGTGCLSMANPGNKTASSAAMPTAADATLWNMAILSTWQQIAPDIYHHTARKRTFAMDDVVEMSIDFVKKFGGLPAPSYSRFASFVSSHNTATIVSALKLADIPAVPQRFPTYGPSAIPGLANEIHSASALDEEPLTCPMCKIDPQQDEVCRECDCCSRDCECPWVIKFDCTVCQHQYWVRGQWTEDRYGMEMELLADNNCPKCGAPDNEPTGFDFADNVPEMQDGKKKSA